MFIELSPWLVIPLLVFTLGFIAAWGITESVSTAAVFTLMEVIGLLIIVFIAFPYEPPEAAAASMTAAASGQEFDAAGILAGAFLAFYAYVGFEDMVNVAEETRNAERNLPIAILASLALATLLYMLVSAASLRVLTPSELGQTDAPLATVFETVTGQPPVLISLISLVAVVNGALIQIIMASRVLYGLCKQGWLWQPLGHVNTRTQTPVNATILVGVIILVAALWLPIETLASITTYLLLSLFCLVNLALLRVKRRPGEPQPRFRVPIAVPALGFLSCLGFLVARTALVLAA